MKVKKAEKCVFFLAIQQKKVVVTPVTVIKEKIVLISLSYFNNPKFMSN